MSNKFFLKLQQPLWRVLLQPTPPETVGSYFSSPAKMKIKHGVADSPQVKCHKIILFAWHSDNFSYCNPDT